MPSLDRLLGRNLGLSRAEARNLLGRLGQDPDFDVPESAMPWPFDMDGRTIQLHDSLHLLLNKPAGCVTALRDQQHPTALSYLTAAPLVSELRPIGRLDLDTTGLLVWTTDGGLIHRLTHPRTAVPRTYHAALARGFQPLPANLVLRDGHRPHVVDLREADGPKMLHPSLVRPPQATVFASITLADGAYHEVRRIFAALGSHVLSLCRVSFGSVQLPHDLQPGAWRPLPREALLPAPTTR